MQRTNIKIKQSILERREAVAVAKAALSSYSWQKQNQTCTVDVTVIHQKSTATGICHTYSQSCSRTAIQNLS